VSRVAERTGYRVRAYQDRDEPDVLELLRASLGEGPAGERTPEFFRWKHLENPFGRSFMLVAEEEGRIIGLRAFLRWILRTGDRELRAVRAVDTATHPEFRGMGVFSRLTLEALGALREEADLVFNTPNAKSLPGYLKMGWRKVGRVPVWIRVRRPVTFARGLRSLDRPAARGRAGPPPGGEEASTALREEGLSLLREDAVAPGDAWATPRSSEYLRWRYGRAPGLGYRVVRDEVAGEVRGMAIYRVRPRGSLWESTIAEVIVRRGDAVTAGRLLRAAALASPVDHAAFSIPGRWAGSGVRRAGYLRAPRGMTLVAKTLTEGIEPDPKQMGSWALSLGDLEVF